MDDNDAAVIESPPSFAKKTKRKKMTHDWSEEDIFKLIGEVECHPCIWNASSADYHNKPMRDNAWTEIGGMLNIRTEEVSTKWSNLRIQYRGYLNKKQNLDKVQTMHQSGNISTPWLLLNVRRLASGNQQQQIYIFHLKAKVN